MFPEVEWFFSYHDNWNSETYHINWHSLWWLLCVYGLFLWSLVSIIVTVVEWYCYWLCHVGSKNGLVWTGSPLVNFTTRVKKLPLQTPSNEFWIGIKHIMPPIMPCHILLVWVAFTLSEKATIRRVTTMLATSKNVLFPDRNHLLTHRYWWAYTLIITGARVIIEVSGHQ